MEGFRARRDGKEFTVDSIEALFALAKQGELRGHDEVLTARGWVRASDLPEFRARFGNDPFDAWSDLDDVDAEAAYRGYVNRTRPPSVAPSVPPPPPSPTPVPPEEDEDPPSVPVEPVAGPPSFTGRGVVYPPPEPPPGMPPGVLPLSRPADRDPALGSLPPLDADRFPTDEGARPGGPRRGSPPPGELIDFPRPTRRRPVDVPTLRERPPQRVPLVRLSWLLLWVAVGVVGLALGYMYIRVATTVPQDIQQVDDRGRPLVGGRPTTVATPTGPDTPVAPDDDVGSPSLAAIETELRAGLTTEVRSITAEGQLGDALLIDLQNLKTDVTSVDAPIRDWTGRKRDVPKVAEIHVRLGSDHDLTRTIGAVALAVGRYKRALRLDVPLLELVVKTDQGTKALTLDARAAEDFYVGRLTLERLLAQMAGG